MILTISGLPQHFNYHDAKAMIKQEAHITNFILDNLLVESNGKKKMQKGRSEKQRPYGQDEPRSAAPVYSGSLPAASQAYGAPHTPKPTQGRGHDPSPSSRGGPPSSYTRQPEPAPKSWERPSYAEEARRPHLAPVAAPKQGLLKTPTRDFVAKPDRFPIERKPSPRRYSPLPPRRASPQPVRRLSPQPLRRPSPQPMRRPSPQPMRRPSPQPMRRPSPQPVRRLSPQPQRRPSPPGMRRPSPQPVRRLSPQPQRRPSPPPQRYVEAKPRYAEAKPSYVAPRVKPAIPAAQAATSGNYSGAYATGGEDPYRPPAAQAPVTQTIPPWQQRRPQPAPEPYVPAAAQYGGQAPYAGPAPHGGSVPHSGPMAHGGPVQYESPISIQYSIPTQYDGQVSYSVPVIHGGSLPQGNPAPYGGSVAYNNPASYGGSAPYGAPEPAPYANRAPVVNQPVRDNWPKAGEPREARDDRVGRRSSPGRRRSVSPRGANWRPLPRSPPRRSDYRSPPRERRVSPPRDRRPSPPRQPGANWRNDLPPREPIPSRFGARSPPRSRGPPTGPPAPFHDDRSNIGPRQGVPFEDAGPHYGPRDGRPRDPSPRRFGPRDVSPGGAPWNARPHDFIPREDGFGGEEFHDERFGDGSIHDGGFRENSRDNLPPGGRPPRQMSFERPGRPPFDKRGPPQHDELPSHHGDRPMVHHGDRLPPHHDDRPPFEHGERLPYHQDGRPPLQHGNRPPPQHGNHPPRHTEKFKPGDREADRDQNYSTEKEMEVRDSVVAKISLNMANRLRPDLAKEEAFLRDLAKLIMDRVDSIFGGRCGNKFGDIVKEYRKMHPVATDPQLMDELLGPTSRKRAAEDPAGPPPKQRQPREVDSRPPQDAFHPAAGPTVSTSKKAPPASKKLPGFVHPTVGGGDDTVVQSILLLTRLKCILDDHNRAVTALPHKLYVCKDNRSDITPEECIQIKKFFKDEIARATQNLELNLNIGIHGVQGFMSIFEITPEDHKSRKWVEYLSLDAFHPFKLILYTSEELNYERASIWLPQYYDASTALKKLELQNNHSENIYIHKWKLLKTVVTSTGTRLFVDIDKASSLALAELSMYLNFEQDKVFVFMRCMSDLEEFDKLFNDNSMCGPSEASIVENTFPDLSCVQDLPSVQQKIQSNKQDLVKRFGVSGDALNLILDIDENSGKHSNRIQHEKPIYEHSPNEAYNPGDPINDDIDEQNYEDAQKVRLKNQSFEHKQNETIYDPKEPINEIIDIDAQNDDTVQMGQCNEERYKRYPEKHIYDPGDPINEIIDIDTMSHRDRCKAQNKKLHEKYTDEPVYDPRVPINDILDIDTQNEGDAQKSQRKYPDEPLYDPSEPINEIIDIGTNNDRDIYRGELEKKTREQCPNETVYDPADPINEIIDIGTHNNYSGAQVQLDYRGNPDEQISGGIDATNKIIIEIGSQNDRVVRMVGQKEIHREPILDETINIPDEPLIEKVQHVHRVQKEKRHRCKPISNRNDLIDIIEINDSDNEEIGATKRRKIELEPISDLEDFSDLEIVSELEDISDVEFASDFEVKSRKKRRQQRRSRFKNISDDEKQYRRRCLLQAQQLALIYADYAVSSKGHGKGKIMSPERYITKRKRRQRGRRKKPLQSVTKKPECE